MKLSEHQESLYWTSEEFLEAIKKESRDTPGDVSDALALEAIRFLLMREKQREDKDETL